MKKNKFLLLGAFILLSCQGPIDTIVANNKPYFGKMIDDVTRFDTVYIDQNRNFYYSYSIQNKNKRIDNKDSLFISKLSEKILQENLIPKVNLENPEFKVLHDNKYNINFIYNDIESGNTLAKVKFKYNSKEYILERKPSELDDVVDLFYNKVILNKN